MTKIERVPGTERRDRFAHLVLVPTGSGFAVWVLISASDLSPETKLWVVSFLPLLGMFAVLAYRSFTQQREPLWPFLPFALAAVVFAVSTVALAEAQDGVGYGQFVVPCLVGLLQPWLALGGGLASYILGPPDQR